MIHKLKTWPEPFDAVANRDKPYEIRKDDRNYAVGDTLLLQEWDPNTKDYTGNEVSRVVTYKTDGGMWGLPPDLCVLGLAVTENEYRSTIAYLQRSDLILEHAQGSQQKLDEAQDAIHSALLLLVSVRGQQTDLRTQLEVAAKAADIHISEAHEARESVRHWQDEATRLRSELKLLASQVDATMSILDSGRVYGQDENEKPTSLVERARNVITALGAEAIGHKEARDLLAEAVRDQASAERMLLRVVRERDEARSELADARAALDRNAVIGEQLRIKREAAEARMREFEKELRQEFYVADNTRAGLRDERGALESDLSDCLCSMWDARSLLMGIKPKPGSRAQRAIEKLSKTLNAFNLTAKPEKATGGES